MMVHSLHERKKSEERTRRDKTRKRSERQRSDNVQRRLHVPHQGRATQRNANRRRSYDIRWTVGVDRKTGGVHAHPVTWKGSGHPCMATRISADIEEFGLRRIKSSPEGRSRSGSCRRAKRSWCRSIRGNSGGNSQNLRNFQPLSPNGWGGRACAF